MIVQWVVEILKDDGAIAALVADRVYPVSLPDAPTYPNIVVSRVGGVGEYDMQGDAGIEQLRLQVDIRGDAGAAQVVAIKELVRAAVTERPPRQPQSPAPSCAIDSAKCINDMDSPAGYPESATVRAGPRVRRRMLEFRIWAKP